MVTASKCSYFYAGASKFCICIDMINAGVVSYLPDTVVLEPGGDRHKLGEVAQVAGSLNKSRKSNKMVV